ncbi:MAG: hypothetical protein K9H64_17375 [Bacteroidales bacterium]|nr:hypothetical protein [Bacteroidales bacterium]MCF8457731.1 hypothetical protein [Bacteroidales bacterium]
MDDRKKDHIEMAFQSRVEAAEQDGRFYYEPFLASHPSGENKPFSFLGKNIRHPLWVSSMTGGTKLARTINTNLAKACHEFGFGMGLGSCRILLEDKKYLPDFDMRDIIGDDLPFYANLGIAQIELSLENSKARSASELVELLRADGLIVHVNPLQEWFQPEGDRLKYPPLETINRFLEDFNFPVIVKEVGQGFGPESIKELLQLPLAAIEFGAFGGTNFAKLELMRGNEEQAELFAPFAKIGHTAADMVEFVNQAIEQSPEPKCKNIIVSGGVQDYLDGFHLINKVKLPAVYGQASAFLKHAREDYVSLQSYIKNQIEGLQLAQSYLSIR